MESTESKLKFFKARYEPAYWVASLLMVLKVICFGIAAVVVLVGAFGATKEGATIFLLGLSFGLFFVGIGFIFEVFAVLIRVLVDQAVSVVPKLTEDERFHIIETLSSVGGDETGSASPTWVSGADIISYVHDRGEKEKLTVAEIVERVRADPGGEHLIWKPGMSGWADPATLSIFSELQNAEEVEDESTE